MTVYALIAALTAQCGPQASFGLNVKLWWSEKNHQLYLSAKCPCADATELAT